VWRELAKNEAKREGGKGGRDETSWKRVGVLKKSL